MHHKLTGATDSSRLEPRCSTAGRRRTASEDYMDLRAAGNNNQRVHSLTWQNQNRKENEVNVTEGLQNVSRSRIAAD